MAWYKTGTINVTNGSATVTLSGGDAFANIYAGDTLHAPDGNQYEIASAPDATTITLVETYAGATAVGQAYKIQPTGNSEVLRQLRDSVGTLVTNYQTVRDEAGQGMFPAGLVGTPSLRNIDDQNTGIYFPNEDEIALVTGGATRLLGTTSGIAITGTLSTSGAATLASASVTGAATIGGTLGVTGAATFNGGVTIGDASGDALAINSSAATIPNGLSFSGGLVTINNASATVQTLNGTAANGMLQRFATTGTARGYVGAGAAVFTGAALSDFGIASESALLFGGPAGVVNGRLASNGLITFGPAVPATSYHRIGDNRLNENDVFMDFYNIQGTYSACYWQLGAGAYGSSTNTVLTIRRNSVTLRSINAGGTVNTSGTDYAEYMRKNGACGILAKGQIVGVNDVAEVIDKWSEAHSFVVKSTDPSYVGGDTWGTADKVGEKPTLPIYVVPEYTGRDKPTPDSPLYDLQLVAWQDDQDAYAAQVAAAEAAHAQATATYQADLAAFEAALETARQCVDRIAFSGQVPCNVDAGTFAPGDYIIAAEGPDDTIVGLVVPAAAMTFAQYMLRVGKVWKVMDDGRAWIDVQHG